MTDLDANTAAACQSNLKREAPVLGRNLIYSLASSKFLAGLNSGKI